MKAIDSIDVSGILFYARIDYFIGRMFTLTVDPSAWRTPLTRYLDMMRKLFLDRLASDSAREKKTEKLNGIKAEARHDPLEF
jgi:hypothetical protein